MSGASNSSFQLLRVYASHSYTPGPVQQATLQVPDPMRDSDDLSLMRKQGDNSYTTDYGNRREGLPSAGLAVLSPRKGSFGWAVKTKSDYSRVQVERSTGAQVW